METASMHVAALPIVVALLSVLIIIPLTLVLVILPFWLICKKAGFHGALSLLVLVPIGNVMLRFMLAFMDWPALQRRE